MPKFFNKFPKTDYDLSLGNSSRGRYAMMTNLLFRVAFVQNVIAENTSSYYDYLIEEGETPEILANEIYDDPELHWIILLANNIVDPDYDWVLDYKSFNNYIVKKYGSLEYAKTNYSHWEKVTTRKDSLTGIETVTRSKINEDNVILSDPSTIDIDGETYPIDHYNSLAEEVIEVYNLDDDTSCTETITKNRVTYYDYENDLNEARRSIKIIKPEYAAQIEEEFNNMTNFVTGPFPGERGLS